MLPRLVVGKILERRLEVNGAGQNLFSCMPAALVFHLRNCWANSGSRSEVCPPACQLRLQTKLLGLMQHA